ncbi:MAG: L-rhamnose mutarotase [Planctomycetes bacterium]|nr:L-rhamnose mutarotase [Planctomycetota bacterium]
MRIAFRMSVHPGCHDEYQRRHNPIWAELTAVLHAHGVQDYAIFLDDSDGSLFGHAVVASRERWDAIAASPVCRRWWAHMRELMPANPDGSPLARELRQVFELAPPA